MQQRIGPYPERCAIAGVLSTITFTSQQGSPSHVISLPHLPLGQPQVAT
jgi:hypothetical protein